RFPRDWSSDVCSSDLRPLRAERLDLRDDGEQLARVLAGERRHRQSGLLPRARRHDVALLLKPLERAPYGRPPDAEAGGDVSLDDTRTVRQPAPDDQFAELTVCLADAVVAQIARTVGGRAAGRPGVGTHCTFTFEGFSCGRPAAPQPRRVRTWIAPPPWPVPYSVVASAALMYRISWSISRGTFRRVSSPPVRTPSTYTTAYSGSAVRMDADPRVRSISGRSISITS